MRAILLTALVLLALPTTAGAAIRHAAPVPLGAADCSTPADACSLLTAVKGGAATDEAVLAPGDYGSPQAPIAVTGVVPQVMRGTLGGPRPRVFVSFGPNVGLGDRISDVELVGVQANGYALMLNGGIHHRVVARTAAPGAIACFVTSASSQLRSSVCLAEGAAHAAYGTTPAGVPFPSGFGGRPSLSVSGSTLLGRGSARAVRVAVSSGVGPQLFLASSIVRSDDGTDLELAAPAGSIAADLALVSWGGTAATSGAVTVTQAGSQAAPPLLDGDGRTLPGSPTLDAGSWSPSVDGEHDVDWRCRSFGPRMDIGATELGSPLHDGACPVFVAPVPPPADPPSAPPGPAPAPVPTPGPDAPAALPLACSGRQVTILDIRASGSRLAVRGLARTTYAGRPVTVRAGSTVLGTATVGPDGAFGLTARRPAGRGARLTAAVDGRTSLAFAVDRRVEVVSRLVRGDRVRVTLVVRGGRAGQPVTIRRQTTCRATTRFATVKLGRGGRLTLSLPLPTAQEGVALYRAIAPLGGRGRTFTLPLAVTRAG